MLNLELLSDKDLIEYASKKNLNPQEQEACAIELQKRAEQRKLRIEQDKILKEQKLATIAEQEQERLKQERLMQEEHDRWLQTPEGQAFKERERLRKEQENLESIEAEEKARAEQAREEEHRTYIQEEFDEREAKQILDKERNLRRWLTNEELNQYRKGSDKWAHVIDIIDSKDHPDYPSMYKQYMRAQGKKLMTPEDNLLISKFNDKFRGQTNNNAIQNTNNSNIIQPINPGTNENDVRLVTIQEASKIIKLNYSYMEKASNQILSAYDKMSAELEKSREHIRKLEKQQLKHSERIESIQSKAYKAELEMFRQKRKYAKKNPIASALEGGAKTVEKVMESLAYVNASPEEKARLDAEKAAKKLAKKLAEDQMMQDQINKIAEQKAKEMLEEMIKNRG